ncbi:MAG: ABC transporter substrate-binding protein [bacterium]
MNKFWWKNIGVLSLLLVILLSGVIFLNNCGEVNPPESSSALRTVTDMAGQEVQIPEDINRLICSGPGCLRLVTYLEGEGEVVGVDSIEKRDSFVEARPYALANPGYAELPLIGEFRGHDNPELIVGLDPAPQLIFKICSGGSREAERLQSKTGVPVLCIDYGKLPDEEEEIRRTLKFMGDVLKKQERAEAVINYFETLKADLRRRTEQLTEAELPTAYLGGLAHRGPHGFRSTNPTYAPFVYLPVKNVAREVLSAGENINHASVNREKILEWDPEYIFIDGASLRLSGRQNALDQLGEHPAYRELSAPQKDHVYILFPENYYNQNLGTVFANTYFIGKKLFPDRFDDIEPLEKAEEISRFLNGGSAYRKIKNDFDNRPFQRVEEFH